MSAEVDPGLLVAHPAGLSAGGPGERRHLPGYVGRRRVGPGGLRRTGRQRELIGAGLIDSFGMAVGWTVLVLCGLARGGIAEAALYNAAMLIGVVLAAPATGWLARRLTGRSLLRTASGVEMGLRVVTLGALVAGAPAAMVALGVTAMYVAAWAGFAAMRAEVSAVDSRPKAMTRFALAIAAIEAVGASVGALLPAGADGRPGGWLLVAIMIVYGGSLLPTMFSARRARVSTGVPLRERRSAPRVRQRVMSPISLVLGGGVMLLAAGPTLLAAPLASELYGRAWVAGATAAFSLGCVLSTAVAAAVGRLRLATIPRWTLWGVAMLVGWVFVPFGPAGLVFAQLLSGAAMTAFEGDMDAQVAAKAPKYGVTTALAYSASARAMGGAVAARALPMIVTAAAVGTGSGIAAAALVMSAVVVWAASRFGLPAVRQWTSRSVLPMRAVSRAA